MLADIPARAFRSDVNNRKIKFFPVLGGRARRPSTTAVPPPSAGLYRENGERERESTRIHTCARLLSKANKYNNRFLKRYHSTGDDYGGST